MTWLRMSDNYASDPVLLNVCRTRADKTRVLGWITELMLYAASHLTDGYLPGLVFRDVVRSQRWRDLLTDPPRGTALIHRPGDDCECMTRNGAMVPWPDTSADFYIHHYLLSNPSREETDVARAKSAELRDRELVAAIRHRDRDRCRYCGIRVRWSDRRSGQGGVVDHVDPAVAAGAANLVVACRGCNSRKGHRTPAAAAMTLLPSPSDLQVGSESDPAQTSGSAADATTHVPVRDGTGRDDVPAHPGGDAGPNGHRPTLGPPTTPRTSRHPNPYRRAAVTGPDPRDNAGLPDPGAVSAALDETTQERINDG